MIAATVTARSTRPRRRDARGITGAWSTRALPYGGSGDVGVTFAAITGPARVAPSNGVGPATGAPVLSVAAASVQAMTRTLDWTAELLAQLEWHWSNQLRPRLDGLTDDEYRWEPAQPAWNVRPRDPARGAAQPGSGPFTVDFAFPEPDPPPVTTIAWRLAHIIVGVLGMRVAAHFGGPPVDYQSFAYAGTAAEALAQLDDAYAAWTAGVRGLDAAGARGAVRAGGGAVRRASRWPRSCCTSTGR